MKYMILLIGIVIGVNCHAQNPVKTDEADPTNVLYRGFTNKVDLTVDNNRANIVIDSITNAKIQKSDIENTFIVRPGSGKTVTLHYSWKDEVTQSNVSKTVEYRVSNLPVPLPHWGGLPSGGIANITSTELSVEYPEGVQLENDNEIVKWEINFEETSVSGDGSNITSAEEFLKKIPSGSVLTFTIDILGWDKIYRIQKAQWQVNSWEEEVRANPIGFDRE